MTADRLELLGQLLLDFHCHWQTGVDQVHVLVNGAVGLLSLRDGRPTSVFSPVMRNGRIVEINILADPERLARLDLRRVT